MTSEQKGVSRYTPNLQTNKFWTQKGEGVKKSQNDVGVINGSSQRRGREGGGTSCGGEVVA